MVTEYLDAKLLPPPPFEKADFKMETSPPEYDPRKDVMFPEPWNATPEQVAQALLDAGERYVAYPASTLWQLVPKEKV
jgi:hypothetical protein